MAKVKEADVKPKNTKFFNIRRVLLGIQKSNAIIKQELAKITLTTMADVKLVKSIEELESASCEAFSALRMAEREESRNARNV